MAPIAGLFLAVFGATLIAGGVIPRWRPRSIWIGFALGAAAAVLFGGHLLRPPPPTAFQLGAIALAVGVEAGAFVMLLPRLYRVGERAVVAGTLAIVGGHLILMLPAFGPAVGVMGVLCAGNALILWRVSPYPLSAGWAVDGAIKLALGVVMLAGFPGLF